MSSDSTYRGKTYQRMFVACPTCSNPMALDFWRNENGKVETTGRCLVCYPPTDKPWGDA